VSVYGSVRTSDNGFLWADMSCCNVAAFVFSVGIRPNHPAPSFPTLAGLHQGADCDHKLAAIAFDGACFWICRCVGSAVVKGF
jgi:hypothetical protein